MISACERHRAGAANRQRRGIDRRAIRLRSAGAQIKHQLRCLGSTQIQRRAVVDLRIHAKRVDPNAAATEYVAAAAEHDLARARHD